MIKHSEPIVERCPVYIKRLLMGIPCAFAIMGIIFCIERLGVM